MVNKRISAGETRKNHTIPIAQEENLKVLSVAAIDDIVANTTECLLVGKKSSNSFPLQALQLEMT
jgi:hypothetical protein